MEIILKSGMIKPLQQNLALLLDIRSQHHRRGNDLCWETNAEHSRRCSAGGRQGHGESFPATRALDDLASRRSMAHPVNRWTDLMHRRKRLATTPNVKCKVICVDELACPQPQQANL